MDADQILFGGGGTVTPRAARQRPPQALNSPIPRPQPRAQVFPVASDESDYAWQTMTAIGLLLVLPLVLYTLVASGAAEPRSILDGVRWTPIGLCGLSCLGFFLSVPLAFWAEITGRWDLGNRCGDVAMVSIGVSLALAPLAFIAYSA